MDTSNNENFDKEVYTTVDATVESALAEEKEEVVKVGNNKHERPKKKGIMLSIIICIVGIICLGVGVFLTVTNSNEDDVSIKKDKGNNNNGSVSLKQIKNYADYNNFELNIVEKMSGPSISVDSLQKCKYDMNSEIYYCEVSSINRVTYSYYDIRNNVVYDSEDNITWTKENSSIYEMPVFLSDYISKVKDMDDVTDLGNGIYSFTVSLREIFTEDYEDKDVPVTISFDINGYLSKMTYDFTDITGEYSEVDEHTVVYEFKNVNSIETISIPEDIVNNAVESEL